MPKSSSIVWDVWEGSTHVMKRTNYKNLAKANLAPISLKQDVQSSTFVRQSD